MHPPLTRCWPGRTAASMRALVLGATGMLGHVVAQRLAERFDLHVGVRDQDRARRLGIAGEPHVIDALAPEALERLIDALRPDVVVNASASSSSSTSRASRSQQSPSTRCCPTASPRCAASGGRLLQVSTDCVFSGALPAPAAIARRTRRTRLTSTAARSCSARSTSRPPDGAQLRSSAASSSGRQASSTGSPAKTAGRCAVPQRDLLRRDHEGAGSDVLVEKSRRITRR